jgi:hypothetical protein
VSSSLFVAAIEPGEQPDEVDQQIDGNGVAVSRDQN